MRTYIRNYKSAQGLGPILVSKIHGCIEIVSRMIFGGGGGGYKGKMFLNGKLCANIFFSLSQNQKNIFSAIFFLKHFIYTVY